MILSSKERDESFIKPNKSQYVAKIIAQAQKMKIHVTESILCLIDYQEKLMPSIYQQEKVILNALRLAKAAKLLHVPIVGTEQNPSKLGGMREDIRALSDAMVEKMHFSACQDGLLEVLNEWGQEQPAQVQAKGNARSLPKHLRHHSPAVAARNSIVIAGCETHICLLQTAVDLLEQDVEVWVVSDACGSRTPENRDAAFDRLASAGAELVTTEMVLYEWLETCEHSKFKDILALVK